VTYHQRPRYLVTDRLRFGDIILIRSKNEAKWTLKDKITSALIAVGGLGQYSHSMVVIGGGNWFDADDKGIGESTFPSERIVKVCRHAGNIRFYVDTEKYGAFDVFRHPDFPVTTNEDDYFEQLKHLLRYLGHQYPQFSELADAASWSPKGLIPFLRKILHNIEAWFFKGSVAPTNPGPFCSQLVAQFYHDINVPLFQGKREPKSVGPNDLAYSRLERITHSCFEYMDDSIEEIDGDKQELWLRHCRLDPDGKENEVRNLTEGCLVIDRLNRRARSSRRSIDLEVIPKRLCGTWVSKSKQTGTTSDESWKISELSVSMNIQIFEPIHVGADLGLYRLPVITLVDQKGEFLQFFLDTNHKDTVTAQFSSRTNGNNEWILSRIG
jgi:hypothetical protein